MDLRAAVFTDDPTDFQKRVVAGHARQRGVLGRGDPAEVRECVAHRVLVAQRGAFEPARRSCALWRARR